MEGLERLKVLASEVKDKAFLKIIEYLLSREDMNEKYLNEEKSLKQMIEFIKSKAKKEAKNGIAMIEDEVVYGWAIHYWDESNESLKMSKTTSNNDDTPKNVKTNESEDNEIDRSSTEKKKPKIWVSEGQLSLFDM